MFDISLPVVFGAGILSFLSPCVLPLVPPYLTYMGGTTFEQLKHDGAAGTLVWRQTTLASLFFILGFSTIFVGLGATATLFGQMLREYLPLLSQFAGAVIIVMGLHYLGVFRLAFLDREIRWQGPSVASGPGGAYLLGLAFALGWTPCIGPILAAILPVAATADTAWQGAGLLAVYSAGLGVPFLIAALAIGPFLGFLARVRKHLHLVEKVMGALLVVTGILFITGNFTRISYWLLETFPALQSFG